jgi:hypothetical protein
MFKVDGKVFCAYARDNRVLEAKKTIFLSKYGMKFFGILFLGKLDTCVQNLISIGGVEH